MRNGDCSESGAVLVIVLGLIVLVSLLVVSMVAISQATYRLAAVEAGRAKASYWAEDAAARMIWLLRDDIAKHSNRKLGGENAAEDLRPRYSANGRKYKILNDDGVEVSVSIYDAASGVDISGSHPSGRLRGMLDLYKDDDTLKMEFKSFLSALDDYVDANDFVRSNGGREVEEYLNLDKYPLPRNRPMRFKWEICWIPGCAKFFKSDSYGRMTEFRIIAPYGLRSLRGRDSFFAASSRDLKASAKLSDSEVDAVLEARTAWQMDRTPLEENMPVGLLSRLRRRFSFRESGCYTFLIEVPAGVDAGLRLLTVTLRVNRYLTTGKQLMYYEWRFLR